MRRGRMLVKVRMVTACGYLTRRMDMIVVDVVMAMAVIVSESWVLVMVLVPFAYEQGSSHDHESSGQHEEWGW